MSTSAWDVRSIGIYGGCFLISLLFMGAAQIFDLEAGMKRRPFPLFCLLSLAVPVILAGVRWQVGTDFKNYQILYETIGGFTTFEEFKLQSSRTEWGYMLLNAVIYHLFRQEQLVFFLTSLMIYGCFFYGIEREHESCSVMLSLYIFYMCFFVQSMNIIRQYIAMAILFLVQRYIWERRPVLFLAGTLAASLFHNTSLVFLPFYFAWGTKETAKWMRAGILLVLAFMLAVFWNGNTFIDASIRFLGEDGITISSNAMGWGILLKRIPLLAVFVWRYKAMTERDSRCGGWLFFYLVSILMYQFGYFYVVFNRLALFFETTLIFLLPHALRSIDNRRERLLAGIAIVIYLGIWGLQSIAVENLGTCIPYQWIGGICK